MKNIVTFLIFFILIGCNQRQNISCDAHEVVIKFHSDWGKFLSGVIDKNQEIDAFQIRSAYLQKTIPSIASYRLTLSLSNHLPKEKREMLLQDLSVAFDKRAYCEGMISSDSRLTLDNIRQWKDIENEIVSIYRRYDLTVSNEPQ
ncbi:hypothetical protein [Persicobacter diffluens]|uniref:Lipoprotein n=1 Tax=Persicobacter diffluens TaxID=981 RepID=A0AAN5AMY5_9BACT|nr:hypothetical protein PEDI_54810 [Persicobacter diffluens]